MKMTKKLVMAAASAIFLPFFANADYALLEWIQGSGSAWIFTGYTPAAGDRVEVKFRPTTTSGNHALFCSREGTSENTLTAFRISATVRLDFGSGQAAQVQKTPAGSLNTSTDYVVALDSRTKKGSLLTGDGTLLGSVTYNTNLTPAGPMALFAAHTLGSGLSASTSLASMAAIGTHRMYWCKVYDSTGALVRWWAPAVDINAEPGAVGRYGVLDLCRNEFWPCLGTAQFTAGPHYGDVGISVARTDSATEFSADGGETWHASLAFDRPAVSSVVTIMARNQSTPGCLFEWGSLPPDTRFGDRYQSSITFRVPVGGASITCAAIGAVNTWTGGSGDFEDAANWSLGHVPLPVENVFFPNAAANYTVTTTARFSIGSLTLGGGEGVGYPTLNFNNGVLTNEVAGTVTIASGATLKHNLNDSSTQRKLCLKCHDMTIASGGLVSADNMGPHYYPCARQPSYGGAGGITSSIASERCRGSIRHPTDLGGNGTGGAHDYSYAGGAIYLEVEGTLAVNGSITALSIGSAYYNGSGGSIYIKTGTLTGTGTIDASAGVNTQSQGGGGGRVAVYQSQATSFGGYSGSYKAYGGRAGWDNTAGCGTIYLEHAADTPGQGTLIVDNGFRPGTLGAPYNQYCACRMDTQMSDEDQVFGTVIVTNNAYLRIASNVTFKVAKRLCTLGGNLVCEGNSDFQFTGAEDALIEGTNSFYSLTCTTPGKTLRFGTGAANKTTIQAGGSLALSGEEGNLLNLRSKTAGTRWQLSVGANGTVNVHHCDVMDSDASSGLAIVNLDGVGGDSENNLNWSSFQTPGLGGLIVWTGGAGTTSWTSGDNWNRGRQPIETDRILIPAGCSVYPVITSSVTVNSLTNEATASLGISGAHLTVTNAFANFGTLTVGTSEELRFSGDGVQDVDLGDGSYSRIVVTKSTGRVNLVSGFYADYLRVRVTGPVALVLPAGETVEAKYLSLFGLVGSSGSYTHALGLSSSGASAALLKATKRQHVRGVSVSNCLSTGAKIMVGTLSTDLGGNGDNWDFSAGAAAERIAAGAFSTASCWADSITPGSATQVCICPPPGTTWAITTSADATTGDLVVGGEGTVTFTADNKITVNGDCNLLSATAVWNYCTEANEITGDLTLAKGATLTHTANDASKKVNLSVSGDCTIESGASIDVSGRGYGANKAAPGRPGASHGGSSYAGIGVQAGGSNFTPSPAYGSALRPYDLGSGSDQNNGGGAVKLVVGGELKVAGSIDARGTYGAGYVAATGGSIWIVANKLTGGGTITASISKGTDPTSAWYASSGGRIAIYATGEDGWSGFSGSIAYEGRAGGTYYRENSAGDGELFIGPSYRDIGNVWLPMAADGDARKAYKRVAVTIADKVNLCITNSTWTAGSTVVFRDLNFTSSNAKLSCLGSTVRILSREHNKGAGWTGGDYASRISSSKVVLGDGGAVVWAGGFVVMFR